MATQLVLMIGAVLLACGSGGLFIVYADNPRLKGLQWLGGSFAAGCLGAFLLFDYRHIPAVLSVLTADVLILAAFVLLHVAFLALVAKEKSLFPVLGAVLLTLQATVDIYLLQFNGTVKLRIFWVGIFVAIQTGHTAAVLLRNRLVAIRAPAIFSAVLLILFTILNLARSLITGSNIVDDPAITYKIALVTYIIYIVVALGMAFGFFWMTATRLTARLEQMASTDPLTRVYNRRVFLDWCEKELQRAQRMRTPFSILMVDLDHFKNINDRFGHHMGDSALCAVVEEIQDSVRGIDVLGRWGGEEFAVLLPGASAGAAFVVAQRVRRNIEKIVLSATRANGTEEPVGLVKVTASVGLAAFRGGDDTIADIMQRADSALYQAKTDGRNRVLSSP